MLDIITVTQCRTPYLSRKQVKQIQQIGLAMLCMTGRVTMVGLSRWTNEGCRYRTIQRWFVSKVEWGALLWAVVEAYLIKTGGTFLLAVDEVLVSKAGKTTHGVERFYSSIAGRLIGGLSFVAASLVDVRQRRSYLVQVEQRLPTPKAAKPENRPTKGGRGLPKGSKHHVKNAPVLNAELTLLDGLLGQSAQANERIEGQTSGHGRLFRELSDRVAGRLA